MISEDEKGLLDCFVNSEYTSDNTFSRRNVFAITKKRLQTDLKNYTGIAVCLKNPARAFRTSVNKTTLKS